MNGIHDLGGMQDMGPIPYARSEPVFHARWEGRAYALTRAAAVWGKWNIDASRFQRELIPPAEYLRMSYYERWLVALQELLLESHLVGAREIETGQPDPAAPRLTPALRADKVADTLARGAPADREVVAQPRFRPGQQVRTRNMHPQGHTRLPRYARGRSGTVVRDHGGFVYPDTNALFEGEQPRHLFSVRFSAAELWGESAHPGDSVYMDLWESYLEPA